VSLQDGPKRTQPPPTSEMLTRWHIPDAGDVDRARLYWSLTGVIPCAARRTCRRAP
jgi:hypothetical protein